MRENKSEKPYKNEHLTPAVFIGSDVLTQLVVISAAAAHASPVVAASTLKATKKNDTGPVT